MNKNTLKIILFLIIAVAIFVPIITSSLLDLKQKKASELILEQTKIEEQEKKVAEEKNYLMGKFDPAKREDFVAVPTEYNIGGYKMYLRKETLDAFLKMQNAADLDGVNLKIASATRNFIYQKNIWNTKNTNPT